MQENTSSYFVTGIGTDVGKTLVSSILVEALKADYWKPVQAGDLDYSDTHKVKEMLTNASSRCFENSYALKTPMSPHAAAEIDGLQIDIKAIKRPKTNNPLVIEGAGGLLVPLNKNDTIVDLIDNEDKIILVSRHYLGSINHTLLSIDFLKRRGFQNIGLIFSGDEHPTTESIIVSKTNVTVIGRVEEEDEITPEVVSIYAKRFQSNLLSF